MTRKMNIEVFFDFICPWCVIGKRHLQTAIQKLKQSDPDVVVNIQWRGVQLLPHIPLLGVPFGAFYLQRLGSSTAVRMRQTQVRQAAKAVNVDIDFDQIRRMPNTAMAHHFFANISKVYHSDQSERFLDALFTAYFHHSENIGELATLQKIAMYCGFADEVVESILAKPFVPFISADTGGKGVPYFVFDGGFAMAGAQHASALYQAMLDTLQVQGQMV